MQEFFESLLKLFTKENITFVFAIIGAIGTFINLIASRRVLELSLHYFGFNQSSRIAMAYISFENASRLPISINDVALVVNGVPCPCRKLPTIAESTRHEWGGVSVQDFYTIQTPINLSALGGTSGYFVFDVPKGIDVSLATPQTFLISPNRGLSLKKKLSPAQEYSGK